MYQQQYVYAGQDRQRPSLKEEAAKTAVQNESILTGSKACLPSYAWCSSAMNNCSTNIRPGQLGVGAGAENDLKYVSLQRWAPSITRDPFAEASVGFWMSGLRQISG